MKSKLVWTISRRYRWQRVLNNEKVLFRSDKSFKYYLDCKRDFSKTVPEIEQFEYGKGIKWLFLLEYRWYIITSRGEIISSSNESFSKYGRCKRKAIKDGMQLENFAGLESFFNPNKFIEY